MSLPVVVGICGACGTVVPPGYMHSCESTGKKALQNRIVQLETDLAQLKSVLGPDGLPKEGFLRKQQDRIDWLYEENARLKTAITEMLETNPAPDLSIQKYWDAYRIMGMIAKEALEGRGAKDG